MRTSRRGFVTMTSLGASALTLGVWGQSAKGATGVVNLYSARHYQTDNALYEQFAQQTGIRVNLVEGNADQLIQRIKSEGANSPADVFVTVDVARLWRAQQDGLFMPVQSRALETNVPASLRDPEGHWFGVSKRARVIMYNKAKVRPEDLSTYEALVDTKWRGKVLTRSSNHVYSQSLTASMLIAAGSEKTEAWARGLVANFARAPQGGDTDQILAVAAGVGDLAISNTYYLPRLIKSEKQEERQAAEKIGVFFPNQNDRGTHVNLSGGGVLKTAPNKEAAVRFMEYLTSAAAQSIFARGNNEYPVLPGASLDPVLASFGTFKGDETNAAMIGKNTPEAIKIMDRAGWK